ncbi:hypothetical protein NQ317_016113 [Molorchus minor]|uniref:DDE Tnp4 domain-containing protein n=1 Tax=Molorchus minor TaxID=1323400 RepID=A0ABQ9IUQ0_9CUCU|nr:hypothetical protein NQ317_016113 [Molorchus minor]
MANRGFILLINAINNDEERNRNRIMRKQLRDQSDPLDMPEIQFRSIYRLSRNMVHNLIVSLGPHIPDGQRERIFIPKKLKLPFIFFPRKLPKRSGQDYFISMSQSSVSRCISTVNTAFEGLYYKIHFPSNEEERSVVKQGFMEMQNGFPGIVGAIDGTQIAISAPSINNELFPPLLFYNRKGFYSLNVQIICDSKLKIMAINARFPGSVHDAAIWTTCQIRELLRNNYIDGDYSSWLIGDSGYPLEPWLMTPVSNNDLTLPEQNYNTSHRSTRNVVERTIGVLKARFRCLLKHRVLHYSPTVAAKIIYSCAVLHNICLEQGEHYIHIADEMENDGNNNNIDALEDNNNQGQQIRNRIITTYFN